MYQLSLMLQVVHQGLQAVHEANYQKVRQTVRSMVLS